jgi:hypothetical protein
VGTLSDSVRIKMGYALDTWGSILCRGKIFLYSVASTGVGLSTASRPNLGSTHPSIQWIPGAISPGVKRPGRKTDHSLPSSEGVKKGGAIPPFPHMSSWHRA